MGTKPPHRRRSVAAPRTMLWFVLATAGYTVGTTGIGWWGATTAHTVRTIIAESILWVIFLLTMLRFLMHRLVRPWQAAAIHDDLTGVLRAGAFWERAERQMTEAMIARHPTAFVFFDLDDFKQINDQYGHAVGDAVLQALSTILRQSVRSGDLLGRLGGEEFGWFMTGVAPADAVLAAQRVLARCRTTAVLPLRGFSLSGGLAVASPDPAEPLTAWDLGRRADYALYQAKAQGKGQIVQFMP
ncbi:GGDEF domain-containing protein [Sulfobacillus harzensis]|uniref:GGDEF domain-containing protein n=1 Tax=Sulfobacillus harzensis TaxID=2729629 RepID=A0A7Y0L431_9FIRM|nr:GGDEF domain-containing protein [Sulfobacillus harzensis]NMP22567.1 GGDEF domain-containing protein [Sulfobacillus harzensis]